VFKTKHPHPLSLALHKHKDYISTSPEQKIIFAYVPISLPTKFFYPRVSPIANTPIDQFVDSIVLDCRTDDLASSILHMLLGNHKYHEIDFELFKLYYDIALALFDVKEPSDKYLAFTFAKVILLISNQKLPINIFYGSEN